MFRKFVGSVDYCYNHNTTISLCIQGLTCFLILATMPEVVVINAFCFNSGIILPGPNTQQVLNACEFPPHQQRPQSILILVKGPCLSRMELGTYGTQSRVRVNPRVLCGASTLGPLGTWLSPTAATRGDKDPSSKPQVDQIKLPDPYPDSVFLSSGANLDTSLHPPFLFPAGYNPGLEQPWHRAGWALNPWSPHPHWAAPEAPPAYPSISFPNHPFSFSPPLALVQHLCSLGDLVHKGYFQLLALFQSHLAVGSWPVLYKGCLLFQILPSTTEEGNPDCLLGSRGKDEKQCLITGTGRGGHRAVLHCQGGLGDQKPLYEGRAGAPVLESQVCFFLAVCP